MKKVYDLEDRTFEYARDVRSLLNSTKPGVLNLEDKRQLLRSSGSVGANFIEAKEALSQKDFVMRIKICRKEAEESNYWLRLISSGLGYSKKEEFNKLIQESLELKRIFGSIINKYKYLRV